MTRIIIDSAETDSTVKRRLDVPADSLISALTSHDAYSFHTAYNAHTTVFLVGDSFTRSVDIHAAPAEPFDTAADTPDEDAPACDVCTRISNPADKDEVEACLSVLTDLGATLVTDDAAK